METELLELKHISPLLEPRVQAIDPCDKIWTLDALSAKRIRLVADPSTGRKFIFEEYKNFSKRYKLLLHPLSSLTKPIEHKGETVVLIDELFMRFGGGVPKPAKALWKIEFAENIINTPYKALSHGVIELLAEHHFDYQLLIPSGLALDKSPSNKL